MQVRIADSGIGIAPENLRLIFEMFTQVRGPAKQTQGGLGIGLALALGVVQMHGGTIEAHSEGLGKGTELIVRLPRLPDEKEMIQIQGAAPGPVEEGRTVAGLRVLAVDDNPDAVKSLAMLLELLGCEVITARDGLEAVQAGELHKPQLVLLDLGMPVLDGFNACRRIREQDWGREMVIVALSGWGQEEDRKRSAEAGFDAHLVKPLDPGILRRLLADPPGFCDASHFP